MEMPTHSTRPKKNTWDTKGGDSIGIPQVFAATAPYANFSRLFLKKGIMYGGMNEI